jgi:predicted Zn-dependent protease
MASRGQVQTSKPVATLLAKAESDLQAGHLERSAASLERAIRISPKNPMVWHRLAEVHLKQSNLRQAEAMAFKSNSLIDRETPLARDNWQIIAEARRLLGDKEGSEEAKQRAR